MRPKPNPDKFPGYVPGCWFGILSKYAGKCFKLELGTKADTVYITFDCGTTGMHVRWMDEWVNDILSPMLSHPTGRVPGCKEGTKVLCPA